MLRLIVFINALSAVANSASITFDQTEPVWQDFKTKFQRNYATAEEEAERKVIFFSNVDLIMRHNREADLGRQTYWMGINQFADRTNEEFNRMNTLDIDVVATDVGEVTPPETMNELELPQQVDWRTKGYVTNVKDQRKCGACWAFSATGTLEGQHFKKTGKLVSLSEQNLIDCSHAEGNRGCSAGNVKFAFNYIIKNKGIDTEECYRYEAKDGTCRFKKSCIGATAQDYTTLLSGYEIALQRAVAQVGPISIAVDASHKSFKLYSHGIYNEPKCGNGQRNLTHYLLAVGYGSTGRWTDEQIQKQDAYWIVKNSWGEKWGDEGYIYMSRNKNNQCGVATRTGYPRL